jgi:hypothetical protein
MEGPCLFSYLALSVCRWRVEVDVEVEVEVEMARSGWAFAMSP